MLLGCGCAAYINLNMGKGQNKEADKGVCNTMVFLTIVMNNVLVKYGAQSAYGKDIPMTADGNCYESKFCTHKYHRRNSSRRTVDH